jgi:hypothetical protein
VGVATRACDGSAGGCGVGWFSCGGASHAVANSRKKTDGRVIFKKLWMQDGRPGFSF